MKQIRGKVTAQHLKQLSTPNFLAVGGKIRNWMKQPTNPYMVKSVPIRPEPRPKPPENLNGREVLPESGAWRGWCKKIGRS